MRQTSIEKIKRNFAIGKVVTITGTGVSVAACPMLKVDGHAVATWPGLLRHGVEFCASKGLMTPEEARALGGLLEVGSTSFLITAAEDISQRMRDSSHGVFRGWLEDTIGKIVVPAAAPLPDLLAALRNIPGLLATLNYDNLLEAATGYKPVTWDQSHQVQKVLRGEASQSVLHLHGHYEAPESVVLGQLSYDKVKNDAHASTVLRSFAIQHTLLFVGCGDTVLDPNFSRLMEWAKDALAEVAPQHYILCRSADTSGFQEKLRAAPWLQPLSYGDAYDDLAPFLQSLYSLTTVTASPISPNAPISPAPIPITDYDIATTPAICSERIKTSTELFNGTTQVDLSTSIEKLEKTELKKPTVDALFDIYSLPVEPYYEVRDLDAVIATATFGAHLWVSGASGVGKTAALQRLAVTSGWRVEHVILASFQNLDALALIAAICTQLYERIGMHDIIVPPVVDIVSILNHLDKIYSTIKDIQTLSIFVEEIPISQGEEYARFLELVYHITLSTGKAKHIRVVWMFSSIENPEKSINPKLKHFRERMQFIQIENWKDIDIRRLIVRIKKSGQIKISPENSKDLVLAANGIPRFVKMVLRRSRNEVASRRPFSAVINSVKKDL
jgi:hypothetical protein